MAKKFEVDTTGRMSKKGKPLTPYQAITFDDMFDWLEENGSKADKAKFKKNYIGDGEGNAPNWSKAKREFLKEFAPQYLPRTKASGRQMKLDKMKDW